MKQPFLFTHGGITLDLSRVKAFHIDSYNPHGKSNILRIEFNTEFDFILNPGSGKFEKVRIEDYTEHAYADYQSAEAYRDEWQGYWQDYLEDRL